MRNTNANLCPTASARVRMHESVVVACDTTVVRRRRAVAADEALTRLTLCRAFGGCRGRQTTMVMERIELMRFLAPAACLGESELSLFDTAWSVAVADSHLSGRRPAAAADRDRSVSQSVSPPIGGYDLWPGASSHAAVGLDLPVVRLSQRPLSASVLAVGELCSAAAAAAAPATSIGPDVSLAAAAAAAGAAIKPAE